MLKLPLTEPVEGLFTPATLPDFHPHLAAELVYCQECRNWHTPAEGWRCPTCGILAAYATQPHTCEDCNRHGLAARCGHRVMSLCLCQETPVSRAIRLRQEQQSRHEAEVERQAAQVARERLSSERRLRGEAAACWASRGQRCQEKPDLYPSCRVCKRWTTERSKPND